MEFLFKYLSPICVVGFVYPTVPEWTAYAKMYFALLLMVAAITSNMQL